jgi:hypothetical protein
VKGDVGVAWQRDEATRAAAIRVELPKDVPAEVVLPETGEVRVNKKNTLPKEVSALPSAGSTRRFRIERGGVYLFELGKP